MCANHPSTPASGRARYQFKLWKLVCVSFTVGIVFFVYFRMAPCIRIYAPALYFYYAFGFLVGIVALRIVYAARQAIDGLSHWFCIRVVFLAILCSLFYMFLNLNDFAPNITGDLQHRNLCAFHYGLAVTLVVAPIVKYVFFCIRRKPRPQANRLVF